MFVTGRVTENAYSYNLSTAYDLSSASYNQSFDVSGEDTNPRGVTFNGDGTKMFVTGADNDSVYSYNLSTAYDISSASYNQNYDVSGQDGDPPDVTFNGDGTKMFVTGRKSDSVYSYNLSTAYDLSMASYNQSFDVSGQGNNPTGVTFNGDGSKMFVVSRNTDTVYRYSSTEEK
jgi:sugar lactone lactonase YvrE